MNYNNKKHHLFCTCARMHRVQTCNYTSSTKTHSRNQRWHAWTKMADTGVLIIIFSILHITCASGVFELQILKLENPDSSLITGLCCEGDGEREACTNSCRTFVSLCLKEYQSSVNWLDETCHFGNTTTDILGDSSFRFTANGEKSLLRIPFSFTWTVRYFLYNRDR